MASGPTQRSGALTRSVAMNVVTAVRRPAGIAARMNQRRRRRASTPGSSSASAAEAAMAVGSPGWTVVATWAAD